MKRGSLLILLLILFCFCQAKVIEKAGNKSLKKLKKRNEDFFIGVSGVSGDLQQAFDAAISHAQTQIVQSLGTQIAISIHVEELENSNDTKFKQTTSIVKKVEYAGVFRLSLKADETYWEKHKEDKIEYYIAYVKVPFSKKEYIRALERDYISQTDKLEKLTKMPIPYNIEQIIAMKKVQDEFAYINASSGRLINKSIYDNYMTAVSKYGNLWADLCRHLQLKLINGDERFPKELFFHLSYKDLDLQDIPVFVKTADTKKYKTNHDGFFSIKPEYSRFIEQDYQVFLASNAGYDEQLPTLSFNLKSPLYNRNLRILVLVQSDNYNEELVQSIDSAFKERGFQYQVASVSPGADLSSFDYLLKIDVKTIFQSKLSNVSQYFYDTQLSIKLSEINTSKELKQWAFPNKQYPEIRSVGQSKKLAQENANALKGLANRNALWADLLQEIEQEVKKKNFSL
ncbi:MAG TPA: hypothetical protein PL139_01045 [Candidatus Cloacimonadota bacterium]|nr:hypothetical protein [Candidatus Cloacimonadota bacterium]